MPNVWQSVVTPKAESGVWWSDGESGQFLVCPLFGGGSVLLVQRVKVGCGKWGVVRRTPNPDFDLVVTSSTSEEVCESW